MSTDFSLPSAELPARNHAILSIGSRNGCASDVSLLVRSNDVALIERPAYRQNFLQIEARFAGTPKAALE
jgi:hypothetical protein